MAWEQEPTVASLRDGHEEGVHLLKRHHVQQQRQHLQREASGMGGQSKAEGKESARTDLHLERFIQARAVRVGNRHKGLVHASGARNARHEALNVPALDTNTNSEVSSAQMGGP
jgi:hypothetical protein